MGSSSSRSVLEMENIYSKEFFAPPVGLFPLSERSETATVEKEEINGREPLSKAATEAKSSHKFSEEEADSKKKTLSKSNTIHVQGVQSEIRANPPGDSNPRIDGMQENIGQPSCRQTSAYIS